MAIEYPDDSTLMIPELRPNRDLIKLRETFGIDPQFLLSDSNQYYTNMNDNMPDEKIDDGIASIDTNLPLYIQDGDGGNNFLQYSDEGAPGYIRPTKTDALMNNDLLNKFNQYENYKYTDQDYTDQINAMRRTNPNFNSYTDQDLKQMIDMGAFSKRSNFEVPEKTGILQSIKDGGSKLLDFIQGGGIVGNIIGGFLPEQSPEAIFMRDYYGGEDGSNLTSTGSIASGLMKGYNPISGGFLNMISGGKFGQPTTYGLQNAYDRRIATIRNTLARKYGDPNYKGDKTKLDERLEKLREEKRKEAEASTAAKAKAANQEVYKSAQEQGFTNNQGGFSTSAADKAGTSEGSGQGFSNKSGKGRTGY
jgi:hypothetical protein